MSFFCSEKKKKDLKIKYRVRFSTKSTNKNINQIDSNFNKNDSTLKVHVSNVLNSIGELVEDINNLRQAMCQISRCPSMQVHLSR